MDFIIGTPSEWDEFAKRNRVFVERLEHIKTACDAVFNRNFTTEQQVDHFVFVAGHLAADDFIEILTMCGNAEAYGAMKILRPMFERVVTRNLH